jgi:hypothetical protein
MYLSMRVREPLPARVEIFAVVVAGICLLAGKNVKCQRGLKGNAHKPPPLGAGITNDWTINKTQKKQDCHF